MMRCKNTDDFFNYGINRKGKAKNYFSRNIDVMVIPDAALPLEVVQNFDLTCCMYYYDGVSVKYALDKETDLDNHGTAYLMPQYYANVAEGSVATMKRLQKYHKRLAQWGKTLQVGDVPLDVKKLFLQVKVLKPLEMNALNPSAFGLNFIFRHKKNKKKKINQRQNLISIYKIADMILPFDDVLKLVAEHHEHLDESKLKTFINKMGRFRSLFPLLVDKATLHNISRILGILGLHYGTNFRELKFDMPQNISPFQRNAWKTLQKISEHLKVEDSQTYAQKEWQTTFNEMVFKFNQDSMERHMYPKEGTIVRKTDCAQCVVGKTTRYKTGRSARFSRIFIPPLVTQTWEHPRNQDMTHTCKEDMQLIHFVTDASTMDGPDADGTPISTFAAGTHVCTHDVIYTHKDLDWYWPADTWSTLLRIVVKWPANAPYYDFCHYETGNGNVCILPPAIWKVVDVHDPDGSSYYVREVFLEPVLLLLDTVSPQLTYDAICDPVALTRALYNRPDCVWSSEGGNTFFYSLSADGIFFQTECMSNFSRKKAMLQNHPDKVGDSPQHARVFDNIRKCYRMEKEILPQVFMRMLHFLAQDLSTSDDETSMSVRANIIPNRYMYDWQTHFVLMDSTELDTPSVENSPSIFGSDFVEHYGDNRKIISGEQSSDPVSYRASLTSKPLSREQHTLNIVKTLLKR